MKPDMLKVALEYAGAGYAVFPCKSKKPLTGEGGFKNATHDEKQIRKWWTRWPDAQIGLPTGQINGLFVLDLDSQQAQEHAEQWNLPETFTVETRPGRKQLWFSQPPGLETKCSAEDLAPKTDTRGDGGYVIAPPSIHHETRQPYRVINDVPYADAGALPAFILRPVAPNNGKVNGEAKSAEKIPEGHRNVKFASLAGTMRRRGMTKEAIEAALLTQNQCCDPPLPEKEVRAVAGSIAKHEPAEPLIKVGSSREDTSNAERFSDQHQERTRYWHGRNRWLLWTGTHWPDDQEAQVVELAKKTARSIYREAASLSDEDECRRMGRWAEKSLNRDRIAAMLDLAKSDPRIAISTDKLDVSPWLMNFTNGTVDLSTGELREHRREDYITKLVRCSYSPGLIAPGWLRFLKQTFGELADWVQKAVGYSLTGITSEKVVILLLGPTDTGKTTFLTVLRTVFADYSKLLQIETLMYSKNQDNNTSADLADLRGTRFAVTSETEEGQRLRESKLKRITQGMGEIKTARKYENPITFPETHKLWIDANFAPAIRGVDDAIWNRLLPIPCEHRVPEAEKDRKLIEKLLHEAEGIVSWVVAGAVRWRNEGLGRPELVEQKRGEWRSAMDLVGEFLDEQCIVDQENRDMAVGATEVYEAFYKWAKEKKHIDHPLTQTAFGTRLTDRGFDKGHDSSTKRATYRGLGLRSLF